LFLLYVADIAQAVPGGMFKLYTDDVNLLVAAINSYELTKIGPTHVIKSLMYEF